jgi:U3 small nucleolar ribonucleoprotein protein IMP4
MNLFITTARKPSQQTRKLARWLETLFDAEYENRGKRSVDEVMQRAASAGYSRVLFIHESHGNPNELVFRDGNEGWLEPSIAIAGASIPERGKRRRLPKNVAVKALDSEGRKIAGLFGIEELDKTNENDSNGEEEVLLIVAGAKELFFETSDGERVGPAIKIARLAKRTE